MVKHCFLFGFIYTQLAFVALAEEANNTVPITKILQDGGWPMIVLALLSVVATFMVIYLFFTLRLNVVMPQDFRMEAEDLATNKDVEALHTICQKNQSQGSEIIGSVTKLLLDNPEVDYAVIRDVIEDEGSRQASALWQKIQYIMDIAVVAPMIGLLGTVLGMIQAFVGLQEDFGSVKPIALANGVSKALITTSAGLILGIIAMIFYAYFRGHVNRLVTQIEEQCNLILHRFIFKKESNTWKTVSE